MGPERDKTEKDCNAADIEAANCQFEASGDYNENLTEPGIVAEVQG